MCLVFFQDGGHRQEIKNCDSWVNILPRDLKSTAQMQTVVGLFTEDLNEIRPVEAELSHF